LMRDVCSLIWLALIGLFRSPASLQAEILTLRHQLNVLRRKSTDLHRHRRSGICRVVSAGCPVGTQSCWQVISNRAMLLPYAKGLVAEGEELGSNPLRVSIATAPVCTENLDSDVVVMKSAKDRI
jgi:hypothetical protein